MGQINELVAQVTQINTANGWREQDMTPLTGDLPKAQIAGMTAVSIQVASIIEAVRTGAGDANGLYQRLSARFYTVEVAGEQLVDGLKEYGRPVYGSKTEAVCRARLIDTETMELTEAIIKGDTANLSEELADIVIRVLDFAGAWNETHPDQPIDLEAAIQAKLERNRQRGYRHGGKLA